MPKEEETKIKIGSGYGTVPAGSPARAIINPSLVVTPDSLKPTAPVKFTQPEIIPEAPEKPVEAPKVDLYQPTQSETETSSILKRARELVTGTAGEAAFRTTKEAEQGIAEKNKVLQELAARSQAIDAQAQAQQLSLEGQGRGQTIDFLDRQKSGIQRQATIAQLGVKAAFETAKGNLAVAQDYVDRAVNAEFAPKKAELDALLKNLELIKADPETTLADKKRADALTLQTEQRKQELAQKEADKKSIFAVMTEAVKNGADALTVRSIQKATTPEEALQVAAPFVGKMEREQQVFEQDLALKKLALEKASSSGIDADPMSLVAYAQQYMATGKIPTGIPKGSFGAIASIAKEMPKPEGQIVSRSTGISPDTLGAAGDAYGAAYSAAKLATQLKELDKKRIGGVVAGTLGKVFGSEDQQRYVDLRNQIVDLLSRARSGAALTESEERRYGNMLPGRFSEPLTLGTDSQARIDNFIDALNSDIQNKMDTKGWAMYGLSKVELGGNEYTVGDEIEVNGVRGRVLPDGSISRL